MIRQKNKYLKSIIGLIAIITIELIFFFFYATNPFSSFMAQRQTHRRENGRDEDPAPLTSNGKHSFDQGKFDEAEHFLIKAIQQNPAHEEALLFLGHLYRYRGRYAESEVLFNKALNGNPQSAHIYTELGKLYRNWNKYEIAEQMFQEAIRINPQDDTIYSYGLGYLYRDMGRLADAEKSFQKAFEINPQNDFNYMGLGDIYRDRGNYKQSEEMFQKAIAMNPKSESYMGLGWLYLRMEKYDLAQHAFETYLKKIRPKSEVYLGLGYILQKKGKNNEAEQAFEKSIELNPTIGGPQALAALYTSQGKNRKATETLKKYNVLKTN